MYTQYKLLLYIDMYHILLSHNIIDFIQSNDETILKILHVKVTYVINYIYRY